MKADIKAKVNKTLALVVFIISIIILRIFAPMSLAFTTEERIEELKTLDEENRERLTLPIATIDFVQPYLIGDYSESEMNEYVKMLKKAGYEGIIIQNIMNIEGGKDSEIKILASWYDTNLIQDKSSLEAYKPAMLDTLVKAIQDNDMKIYIGLASTNDWWNSDFRDEEWRIKNTNFLNEMINEVYQKYKEYECFEGIYWTNEIYTNGDDYYGYWSEMINENAEYLQKIDIGEKKHKFVLSPFISQIYELTNEQIYEDWRNMIEQINFRQGDIICVQDGLGTSSFEPKKVQKYIEALQQAVKNNDKKGVEFWLNVENYETINGEGKPSTLERYKLQLSICSKYADGLTSFSYSHYYNPTVVDASFDEQYRKYYNSIIEEEKNNINDNDNTETDNKNEIGNKNEENKTETNNKNEENKIVLENKTETDREKDETAKSYKDANTANKIIPQTGDNEIIRTIIILMTSVIMVFSIFFQIKYIYQKIIKN